VRPQLSLEREFDQLSWIVEPEQWAQECPLFWEELERTSEGMFAGTLRLPGSRTSSRVTLKGTVKADAMSAAAELEIVSGAPLGGHVTLHVDALERPGWTRVVQERDVTFAPGLLHTYEAETLTYWTKSEVACLALL